MSGRKILGAGVVGSLALAGCQPEDEAPEPIGEWHFGKDGVPVIGPPPNPATTTKPTTPETDGRSRIDRGGKGAER